MANKIFGNRVGDDVNSFSPVGRPMNKKKFKMPASMTIILGILFFSIALTWMFPGNNNITPASFGAFGGMILEGFTSKAGVIFYLFVLGAFIEVLLRTKTLERGISTLANKLQNKIVWSIPILFFLFSLGGTLYGMQEETVGFFIILVPFFVIAGFDTMTALLVILLGTTTGFAFSIVNPFAIGAGYDAAMDGSWVGLTQTEAADAVFDFLFIDNGVEYAVFDMSNVANWGSNTAANDGLKIIDSTGNEQILSPSHYIVSTNAEFIKNSGGSWLIEPKDGKVSLFIGTFGTGDGLMLRTIMWFFATTSGAAFLTWYGNRVYKDNKKSWVADQMQADLKWAQSHMGDSSDLKMTKKHKAALMIMGLAFVAMILGFLPWKTILGDAYVPTDSFPAWIGIFWGSWGGGDQYAIMGEWFWGDLITVFLLATLIIMLIFRYSWKQMIATIYAGAKEMFTLTLLIGVAASIGIVLQTSGLSGEMVTGLSSGLKGTSPMVFLLLLFLIFIVMAFIIPSTTGLATAILPIISGMVVGQVSQLDSGTMITGAVFLFSIALGAINMFIPTQAVVMAQADVSRVGYQKMAKIAVPYAAVTLLVSAAIVIPVVGAGI